MYGSKQALIDAIGRDRVLQLADPTAVISDINDPAIDAKIDRARGQATGLIDSYAKTRYQIPLTETDIVAALVLDLVLFSLGWPPDKDERKAVYDRRVAVLKDISSGKATLDGQVLGTATEQTGSSGGPVHDNREYFSDDEKLVDF